MKHTNGHHGLTIQNSCLHHGLINTGEHEVLRFMRNVTMVRDRLHALIGLIPTAGHSGCEKGHHVRPYLE
jgi:hypothetical protein